MKITVLKESLSIGGTERSTANISKALSINPNNDISLILFDARNTKYTYGGNLIDFKLPASSNYIKKILNTFLRHLKLKMYIKNKKPDILYTFTSISNYTTKFKYKNTIKIISARDYGALLRMHNNYNNALNNSDAMICNSYYIKQEFLNNHPEQKDKVFTVHNVIDCPKIREQSKESTEPEFNRFIESHKNTIVAIGRFCKEKGFEFLLKAFVNAKKEQIELGLVLIGDGDEEYKNKYAEIIKTHNLDNDIYLTGFQKNPYKYIAKCSCFVLSSVSEGFPNVLAEGMALGLPVISTNCFSGPAEILTKTNDYNLAINSFELCDYGILTPRFTYEDNSHAINELSSAISYLITNDDLKSKYSELSKKRAEDFSSEKACFELMNIFNLLKERKSND